MKKPLFAAFTLLLAFLSFSQHSHAQCTANFSAAPVPGSLVVDFTNTSIGASPASGLVCTWTFGDGGSATTSGLASTSHTYPSSGGYAVCLTISDPSIGCSSSYCDSVYVSGGGSPWCSAYFYSGVSGCDVNFSNASSASGTILSYAWDFGDGATSTAASPSHSYAGPGPWSVTLSITTSDGCSNTVTLPVDSLPGCCSAGGWSIADFSYSVSGCDVSFTDMSTASSAITGYLWEFGDGGTSTVASPTHTYGSAGYWPVRLTITNAGGCTDTANAGVSTTFCGGAGCAASYWWVNDSSGTYSILLYPSYSSSSPAATSYLWDFGDGATSTSAYPSHVYAGPGTYVVCVTMTDASVPCTVTYCDTLLVTFKTAVPFSINVVDVAADVGQPAMDPFLSVSPNPFSDALNLSLSLNEAADVSVSLVDIAGRVVSSAHAGNLSAGSHSLSLNTADVAPGIYLVRVKTGDQTFTRKVVAH